MLIGYARVSTSEQETDLQLDALKAAGVTTIYQEKASGISQRPVLRQVVKDLRAGFVLVVWKIDRLARSLADLLQLLDAITSKGASFRSLTEPIDTTTPMGLFVLQVLGAVAQLERSIIIQRTTAGIAAARRRGDPWGRRPALTNTQRLELLERVEAGHRPTDIARDLGISRPTVYAYVSRNSNKDPTATKVEKLKKPTKTRQKTVLP